MNQNSFVIASVLFGFFRCKLSVCDFSQFARWQLDDCSERDFDFNGLKFLRLWGVRCRLWTFLLFGFRNNDIFNLSLRLRLVRLEWYFNIVLWSGALAWFRLIITNFIKGFLKVYVACLECSNDPLILHVFRFVRILLSKLFDGLIINCGVYPPIFAHFFSLKWNFNRNHIIYINNYSVNMNTLTCNDKN